MADTKETILDRLMVNIDDKYDKSEGSFFYDVEAPIAAELESVYAEQEAILDEGFAVTATGVYLDRKVAEQGLTRKVAQASTTTVTITGAEGASIAVGALVASDTIFYAVTTATTIAAGQTTMIVPVQCTIAGITGNVPIGAIKSFPATIAGLSTVTNVAAVTNGYAEETDSELRARYMEKIQAPATSGNKYHYAIWAKEVTGVGDAKVLPLWNGNGTVKVVIINSNKRAADSTLINNTAAYIDDNRPIGSTVTVVSAAELAINVSVTITLASGYELADVKATIESELTAYFASIAFKETYVSYSRISSIILNTAGVFDHSSLLINNDTENIAIADTQVAVLGTVTASNG